MRVGAGRRVSQARSEDDEELLVFNISGLDGV
jgi:hypothetical protein